MYQYKDIKQVHLEVTEKCNAACPMCPRNISGGKESSFIINAELSLADCKKMFDPAFIKQLNIMYMCGNYGDPMMAKDTLKIFKYFREHNSKMKLRMNTNAGARPAKWWVELAKTIGKRGRVVFSVDGLKDTNHLYRQHVKWNIVERSMKAYIGAGGIARWDYLVFKHNEHQVEEAKKLSQKLGFAGFQAKKTSRFYNNPLYNGIRPIEVEGYQVLDNDGNNTHVLEPPTNEKYQNTVAKTANQYVKEHGISFYDSTEIDAKCIIKKEIYVSARGFILPCCWIGGTLLESIQSLEYMNKAGGPDAINALKPWNTLESILDKTNFFSNIENSWTLPSIEKGKMDVCTRMCATGVDKFSAQFSIQY